VPLATNSLKLQGVRTAGIGANPNVEQMIRKDKSGKLWQIVINHGEESVRSVNTNSIQLSPFDIQIREVVHQLAHLREVVVVARDLDDPRHVVVRVLVVGGRADALQQVVEVLVGD
jgi:hypothetical protein